MDTNTQILQHEAGGLMLCVGGSVSMAVSRIRIDTARGFATVRLPLTHVRLAPYVKPAQVEAPKPGSSDGGNVVYANFRRVQADDEGEKPEPDPVPA